MLPGGLGRLLGPMLQAEETWIFILSLSHTTVCFWTCHITSLSLFPHLGNYADNASLPLWL